MCLKCGLKPSVGWEHGRWLWRYIVHVYMANKQTQQMEPVMCGRKWMITKENITWRVWFEPPSNAAHASTDDSDLQKWLAVQKHSWLWFACRKSHSHPIYINVYAPSESGSDSKLTCTNIHQHFRRSYCEFGSSLVYIAWLLTGLVCPGMSTKQTAAFPFYL